MFTITIAAGAQASEIITLGNHQLATVFTPEVAGDPFDVFVYGSADGISFGPMFRIGSEDALKFQVKPHVSVRTFDPNDFEGVQYMRFVLAAPAARELSFPVYLKGF